MSVIHTPRRPELDLRLVLFPVAMLALLTILFLRLWYFQVVKAPELTERAEATRKDTISHPAPRGLIYDRNGELIAGLRPELVVSGVYSIVSKNLDEQSRLADLLGVSLAKTLKPKLDLARHSPGLPSPLVIGVDPEVATRIAEAQSQFPGVSVDLTPTRYYPNSFDFSHVLGYVRLPNKDDVRRFKDKDLQVPQFVGKSGVERSYETDLMGSPGQEVMEIDSKRRPLRIVQRDNPVAGKQLVLSLDSKLQHLATQLMAQNSYKGAIVAVEPSSGEVLCMVSSPTFDLNKFQAGFSKPDWDKIQKDPTNPEQKRAIESSYSPGSTFKIVTSLAAYNVGKFDTNRPVFCDGGYHLGKAFIKCLSHHGEITFKTALEKSCNTFFADLGFRVGPEALRHACDEVGLGQTTGLDIGGERVGIVPNEAFIAKHPKRRKWHGGDTVNLSIGQGYLQTTPLQMCDVAAMVANDGTIYRPHLVREVKDFTDPSLSRVIGPEVLHQATASPEFWATMKDALHGVVEVGTAQRAKIPGIEWAGKTGSTEHGRSLDKDGKPVKTHSWFVGFAPLDKPKIAICVLVEDAGHGGDVSAPIAKQIVESYLKPVKAKPQTRTGPEAEVDQSTVAN